MTKGVMIREYLKRAIILGLTFMIVLGVFKTESFAFSNVLSESAIISSEDVNADYLDIPEEDVPLGILKTNTAVSWWWLFIIIVVGTVGAELLSRRHMNADKKSCTFESLSEIKGNVNMK